MMRIVLSTILAVAIAVGCAERDRNEKTYVPGAVVSVDDTVLVNPSVVSGTTAAAIRANCPSSVELSTDLVSADGGFVLGLAWSFAGVTPDYWDVRRYSDRQDGTTETFYNGGTFVRTGDSLAYRSGVLQRGRFYRFNLNSYPSNAVGGSIQYKSVFVDLRGVR